jgi:macrolide transport system ATP-binding/permease protein
MRALPVVRTVRRTLARVAGLVFRRRARERELADEIESHLALHIDDNLRRGLAPDEARRQARLALGGMEAMKEAYRDQGTVPVVEHTVQDIRLALRQLAKSPGLAVTATVVLALGMGGCLAVFGFVEAALLRPLPYREPARLLAVSGALAQMPRANLSYEDYKDFKAMNTVFTSLDAYNVGGHMLSTPRGAAIVSGIRVSDGFFRTLGVTPILGRDFAPGEDLPTGPRLALITHRSWQDRFGGNRQVVGTSVMLSGIAHTIIGVLPRAFQFAPSESAEFWTTLHADSGCDTRRSCHNMNAIARLKDGVTVDQAAAAMTLVAARLEKQYPDSNRGQFVRVEPLADIIVGDIRPTLWLLLGGAALLLVIACVNVVSLLLVRTESRRRELALRLALGASRGRIVRHFVTEAAVLVALGAGLALVVADLGMRLLVGLIPADMMLTLPFLEGLGLNRVVVAGAAAVALLALGIFSLGPLAVHSATDVRAGMADGGRGASGHAWRRMGARLVVVELATAMVLLAGAGLLGRSLHRLLNVELGFRPEQLAAVRLAAPGVLFQKPGAAERLALDVERRVAALPGVTAVGLTSVLPVSFNGNTTWIRFVGRPYNGEHNESNQRDVSPGYFATIGARLVAGRTFTAADDAASPKVVVINQTLARMHFPDQDPVGQRIGDTSLSPGSITEIVGVVADIREGGLSQDIWPAVYLPMAQSPNTDFAVVVRTAQDPAAMVPALAAAIRQLHGDLGVFGEAVIAERIDASPAAYLQRSSAWLVGAFAAVALILGVVGLYGVIAYSASQRTREMGVRIALGAGRATVYRLILREAGVLALVGIAVGLTGAVAVATLMRKLLFDTPPWDVATLATVAALLGSAALAASAIPARRAASVDPIDALRAE